MGAKKSTQTNIRKITKVGLQSLAVTLPIDLVRKLKWKEKQKVVIKKQGNKLVISDWKPKR